MSSQPVTASQAWQVFDVKTLQHSVVGNSPRIREFLRAPTLSCAIYHLPAGSKDMQAPHLEDEVYFVVEGKATLDVDGQTKLVVPGNILYVRAKTEHSFFDITEDLTVIALFGSQQALR